MSTTTDRSEARRRARIAARGDFDEEQNAAPEPDPEPERRSGGLLARIFPPAPSLPGRPDPLAGFDESGPLRPVRVRAFLLRRNLLAWLATGVIAFIGASASLFYGPQSIISLLGTFVLFGSLIAAGWFGWQRPSLYGTAAALVGFLLFTVFVLIATLQLGAEPDTFGPPGEIAFGTALQAVYQAGLGFLGGWYGGYLRRRQTQLSADVRRRR